MPNDDLNRAKRMLSEAQEKMKNSNLQRERSSIVASVAGEVAKMFVPFLKEIRELARVNKEDVVDAISNIKLENKVPEIRVDAPIIPEIRVPEPRVNVSVPPIKVPDIAMPDQMDIKGWVNMMISDEPVSLMNPMPVTLRDANGAPLDILGNLSTIVSGGGGGGKRDYFTIKDIRASSASLIDQIDGALKVTGSLSATLSTDTGIGETGTNTIRITEATDSVVSSDLRYIAGTATAVNAGVVNDGTLRVTQATDSVTSVNIVSGSSAGTEYADGATADPATGTLAMGDTGEESGNIFALHTHSGVVGSGVLRVVHASDVGLSANITNTVTVSGTLSSTGAYLLDGDGTYRSTLPVEGTVVVSSITASTASALVDSTGVQYSGSNPVPVTATVSGSITSTVAVGDTESDATDSGSAPVKTGGIARTANPTAVGNGDRVSATYDDVGRQLVRPVQVRDLLQTAYVEAASEGEKTLLAGASGVYHDLVYMMAANSSDAAITLDIRQTTGGTVQSTIEVPANATAGLALGGATIPQDHADATWTVDNNSADASNTTYAVTALFSKEV